MAKIRKKKDRETKQDFIEFVLERPLPSSGEQVEQREEVPAVEAGTLSPSATLEDMPPVFRELAVPKLPPLTHTNRARLLMQSPNRLFFYWSVGPNPIHKLDRALGTHTASYSLVLKLVDLNRDVERMYRVESEGTWWFDVEANGRYRAEIGFYAPNRPYVRALYSNTVETPRKTPSPRVDTEADWTISSDRFAQVLEVAGFTQDAFEVAIAGDDQETTQALTLTAFGELVGDETIDVDGISSDELRHAMLLLASGVPLEGLRWQISPALFAVLQKYAASLSAQKASQVLQERFDIEVSETTEEEFGPAVFGASLVNFPRRLRTRRKVPFPVSSPARPSSSRN